jgi:phosphohistidine phosphatase
MKTLYLLRHAKSSWDYPDLSDHDRPLNTRGRHDAALMGQQMMSREICPDLVLTSTAVRALSTATLVSRELNYDLEKIHTDPNIYQSDKDGLLEIIRNVPDEIETLLFVAHNFAVSELANKLAEDSVADMPTAGIVALEFPVISWLEVMPDKGKLLFTDKPKNYKDKDKKDKEKDREKKNRQHEDEDDKDKDREKKNRQHEDEDDKDKDREKKNRKHEDEDDKE